VDSETARDAAAAAFAPDLDAVKEWPRFAREAGARYVTLTAKHHDGYALCATDTSDYGVAAARNVVGTLAAACREDDIALFLYYSLLDWHEPTYEADFARYLDFLGRQLEELLTGYGPVAGIWFDGAWSRPMSDWRLEQIYDGIHELRPDALVGNNHHVVPLAGEDFQIYEGAFPEEVQYGGKVVPRTAVPAEICAKLGPTWFYGNNGYVADREHAAGLLDAAAKRDLNLLLNVPPAPDGTIDAEYWAALEGLRQPL
jgi:alpha-L-fucosidase